MTQVKTYKDVKVKGEVTPEIIDFVCENYQTKSNNEIADELNLSNRQVVTGILRILYAHNHVKKCTKIIVGKKRKMDRPAFDNYYGAKKAEARALIVDRVTSINNRGSNILTLPAKYWIMEKLILDRIQTAKFVAVEEDKKVFNTMVRNMTKDATILNAVNSVYNGKLSTVIHKANENEFSHAILDYCGVIDTYIEEIIFLLENNIVRQNGFITITLSQVNRTIHNHNNESTKLLNIIGNDSGMTDSIFSTDFLMKTILYNLNGRYKLDTTFKYKDTAKGYGMLLYIVKRIK